MRIIFNIVSLVWFLFLSMHCCSVTQSYLTLWPHRLQHSRLPCLSPSSGACSNSHPLSQWCHTTISSSVIPFSSCLQFFPASGAFLMSQLFASVGQSIGVSASASVLSKNIQDWFPLGRTGLISLQSKGLWIVFSNTTIQKHKFFSAQPFLWSISHICTMTTGKIITLTIWTFASKVISLLFNMLSSILFCHNFPSKKQASFNLMASVTIHSDFRAQEEKICHWFYFFPFYLPCIDVTHCHHFSFLNAEFQTNFFTLPFHHYPEAPLVAEDRVIYIENTKESTKNNSRILDK